jgi:hypothetical protein
VLLDAAVVTDLETGRIEETNACAMTEATTEIGTQRQQGTGYPLNKAPIADQAWKCTLPLHLHLLLIVGFEVAVARLMKPNQYRHDFAEAQTPASMAMSEPTARQLLVPHWFKRLAEVVNAAEQFF